MIAQWEVLVPVLVIVGVSGSLLFSIGHLELAHFALFVAAHVHVALVVLFLVAVIVLIVAIVEVHAIGLSLTTKHGRLHVSLFLISLRLHLLQEVLAVGFFEDSAGLFLLFIRLEEDSTKDLGSDSLMETIRHELSKLIQFLLLILRVLSLLDESDDLLLDFLWQIQMVHGRVDCIDLFLEDDGLLVDVVYKDSQLTEKVSLGNGSHDISYRNEYELLIISATQIVTEQEEATGVEAYAVFVWIRFVKERSSVIPSPNVVQWRNPLLLAINDIEPNASNEVNIHEEEKDKFYKFN